MMTSRRSIAVSPMVVCRRERSSCWPSGNAGCSSCRLTKGSVPYQKMLSTAADLKSQITRVIMGKHKPIYDPSFVVGDFVVVINADKSASLTLMCSFACSIAHMPLIPSIPSRCSFRVKLTGRKMDQKLYTYHTGYPGGLVRVRREAAKGQNGQRGGRGAQYRRGPQRSLHIGYNGPGESADSICRSREAAKGEGRGGRSRILCV